ncbi:MAG: FAD-binding protein [Deltaproteobacteria bacterium]|nr:FAD-binding protein [Deltaproteobacteria bacterium]
MSAPICIVGSGAAGLLCALQASQRHPVLLLSAGRPSDPTPSASALAQGGIAAASASADAMQQHVLDTLAVAGGLADRQAVTSVVGAAPALIARLYDLGCRFSADRAREGGHSVARIWHSADRTGAAVIDALNASVRRQPRIIWRQQTCVEALLRDGEGRVCGVRCRRGRSVVNVPAAAVVLATGGSGALYAQTTNPSWATGSGLALALGVGAELIDMEFVQFHPTALDVRRASSALSVARLPLLSEALRGAGATLVDGAGRRVMVGEHPLEDLAPRDVVTRAVWSRVSQGERVYLDLRGVADLQERFPAAWQACHEHRFDPRGEPVPVVPAAHYHMGGIAVDVDGRSSVDGLWAAGEVACSGMHGANRLASNSLLEAMVIGARVGQALAERDLPHLQPATLVEEAGSTDRCDGALRARFRTAMWRSLGVVRTRFGMQRLAERLTQWASAGDAGLRQMVAVAQVMVGAALVRSSSVGAHWVVDRATPEPPAESQLYRLRYRQGDFVRSGLQKSGAIGTRTELISAACNAS